MPFMSFCQHLRALTEAREAIGDMVEGRKYVRFLGCACSISRRRWAVSRDVAAPPALPVKIDASWRCPDCPLLFAPLRRSDGAV